MKEKLLKAFSDLGFKLEEAEGIGYFFNYEGLNLLVMYNESDEDFLNIALPCICKFEEDKALQICALLEKINSTIKYVKAYILSDSVCLFYERELLSEAEDLMMVISHMIRHLEMGYNFACAAMKEIENFITDSTADESDAEVMKSEESGDNSDGENG